jgi:hypothetical protein
MLDVGGVEACEAGEASCRLSLSVFAMTGKTRGHGITLAVGGNIGSVGGEGRVAECRYQERGQHGVFERTKMVAARCAIASDRRE